MRVKVAKKGRKHDIQTIKGVKTGVEVHRGSKKQRNLIG
jgi:hypothetical protein